MKDRITKASGIRPDVSVQGLFVTSAAAPRVRTAVNVEVLLPPSLGHMPENIKKAPGYVVWNGPSDPHGFAIVAHPGMDFAIAESYLQ